MTGSRLGAAAVVVAVGALDFVQQEADATDGYALREAVSMGVLTFLVTHSIYLGVAFVGYLTVPLLLPALRISRPTPPGGISAGSPLDPVLSAITATVGPHVTYGLALGVLFVSLWLFDRVLDQVDTEILRTRLFGQFKRTWLSFVVGLAVTTLTFSVAFSLGVIVPLYNREYVTRAELVPYILGANLGTLVDTLLVAVVLRTPRGVQTILLLLGIATAITLVTLIVQSRYVAVVRTVDDHLLANRRAFLRFAGLLLVVPLLMILAPLLVAWLLAAVSRL